jgi:subtilisin family serine protease
MGLQVQADKFNFNNSVFIQPAPKFVEQIAGLPFVYYITNQSIKDKPINYNNTSTHAVSGLQSPAGRNLLGRNVTIGVGDNADIVSGHIDFTGRVILRHPFGMDYHGTHTSGTAAGGGLIDPKRRGMAPKANIISQWFSDVLLNTPTYVVDNNIIATNNSYYSVAVGCPGEGVYDALSNYVDAQMRNYDEVLHVIASGNDASLACSPYPQGFATVKSGWQSAKNVLTVGSMDQASYNIALYSSRGPVKDGRIKPEITANGASYSTYPVNTYGLSFGTSMAAPVVTGATALMQERYRQLHAGTNAKAVLVKALLCNNADDLGNPGPDFKFGFGMLNVRKAIEAMEANQYYTNSIANTQNQSFNINVPAGARRLKVLLTWNDYPASPMRPMLW